MSKWQYTKGLHDLGRGCYAYLQPDGSWGWSNAGLIIDGEANLRQYEPDFVARTTDSGYWLLETKGREDADVQRKDERAEKWCADVTALAGQTWRYLKVPDREFKKLKPASFDELVSALQAGGPMFIAD